MGSSFVRVGDDPSAPKQQPPTAAAARSTAAPQQEDAPAPQQGAASEAAEEAPGGNDDELRPVDLDLNLASSLLESFASQQGLPGPTSNFIGMLGQASRSRPDTVDT